ncbi:hypothetical protein C8R43DRAFT_942646 [Mycena crocata]|nr:hypothetical protein C8R43DRAFT_942646 [Mycena crocata]
MFTCAATRLDSRRGIHPDASLRNNPDSSSADDTDSWADGLALEQPCDSARLDSAQNRVREMWPFDEFETRQSTRGRSCATGRDSGAEWTQRRVVVRCGQAAQDEPLYTPPSSICRTSQYLSIRSKDQHTSTVQSKYPPFNIMFHISMCLRLPASLYFLLHLPRETRLTDPQLAQPGDGNVIEDLRELDIVRVCAKQDQIAEIENRSGFCAEPEVGLFCAASDGYRGVDEARHLAQDLRALALVKGPSSLGRLPSPNFSRRSIGVLPRCLGR